MSKHITIKVYYVENKSTKEIRKFSVEQDLVGSFEYLIGKIRTVFPDLLRKDLELSWKDEENDYISVSSDEELVQALNANATQTKCLKFYVQTKSSKDGKNSGSNADDESHPGVICDGCDAPIRGIRFKCLECHDFDLCNSCEKKGAHPGDHEMLKIRTPRRSSNIYVTRVPPFRFGQRSQYSPWFCRRRQRNWNGCPFESQPQKCGGKSQEERQSSKNEEKPDSGVKDIITGFASAFGLDPEVAVSSLRAFVENLADNKTSNAQAKENKSASAETKDSDRKEETEELQAYEGPIEVILKKGMEMFGLNEQVLSEVAKSFAEELNDDETNRKEDVEMKDGEKQKQPQNFSDEATDFKVDSSNTGTRKKEEKVNPTAKQVEKSDMEVESLTIGEDENLKNSDNKDASNGENNKLLHDGKSQPPPQDVNNLAAGFVKQFSASSELENMPNSTQYANLGQLMNNIFHSYAGNGAGANSQSTKENDRKPDDFVMVDDGKSSDEKYQQRLEKALRQMEAMGFDNEGGWLRQLLVSKDLSIARVLDALNP